MNSNLEALFKAAKRARENAHAPYSNFHVGAALLAEDGQIYTGANVENAAYPQSQCAEASAIGAMITAGSKNIKEIAVVAAGKELCTPCGGCRQRIREFAGPEVIIHIFGLQGHRRSFRLAELLPEAFGPENVSKG